MNSLFDRLGLYEFFNVIVAGGIVLLYSIGVANQQCILFKDSWTLGLFPLLAVYVLGIICQEIGRFITETWLRIKDKQIEHMPETEENEEDFLAKRIRVTDNKCKLEDYEKKLRRYANILKMMQ